MEMGSRLGIFYVTLVMGIWLLIIDAINPVSFGTFDDLTEQEWTWYLKVISGFLMGLAAICAIMVLLWFSPRCAGLTILVVVLLAAILRIVAETVGFENFSGGVKQSSFHQF